MKNNQPLCLMQLYNARSLKIWILQEQQRQQLWTLNPLHRTQKHNKYY